MIQTISLYDKILMLLKSIKIRYVVNPFDKPFDRRSKVNDARRASATNGSKGPKNLKAYLFMLERHKRVNKYDSRRRM
jgi:hypothetical protein